MAAISESSLRSNRAWMDLHPWVRAGAVGVSILVADLAVYWALWQYWVVQPNGDAAQDLALQLLFGLTVAAFTTVLVAGVLGYRAHRGAEEVVTPNVAPLSLSAARIETGERASSLLGVRPVKIGLTLVNNSDHLESWFRIALDLPILGPVWREFGPSDDQVDRALFLAWAIPQRLNDAGENWQLAFRDDGAASQVSALYQSRGDTAVFPQSEALLCTLSLPTENFRAGQTFACRYRIESAHAAPSEETLVIRM